MSWPGIWRRATFLGSAGHKDNEISVAPLLLRGINLRGKIVAADAMHTQQEISAHIVAARGEYLFLVKNNQPTLRKEVELLFSGDDRTVEGRLASTTQQ